RWARIAPELDVARVGYDAIYDGAWPVCIGPGESRIGPCAGKGVKPIGRSRLIAGRRRRRSKSRVGGHLAVEEIVGGIDRVLQTVVAGLNQAGRVPGLLQGGEREVRVVVLCAAVEHVMIVHRVVGR